MSRGLDQLDIFVADAQGRTMSAAWEPGFADGWHGWWHIGGGLTSATGFVTVISRAPNTLDIFTVGIDGRAYTSGWSPAAPWAPWQAISGTGVNLSAPVWPASRASDIVDVVFTSKDRNGYTAGWQVGGAWGGPWQINDHWDLQ